MCQLSIKNYKHLRIYSGRSNSKQIYHGCSLKFTETQVNVGPAFESGAVGVSTPRYSKSTVFIRSLKGIQNVWGITTSGFYHYISFIAFPDALVNVEPCSEARSISVSTPRCGKSTVLFRSWKRIQNVWGIAFQSISLHPLPEAESKVGPRLKSTNVSVLDFLKGK